MIIYRLKIFDNFNYMEGSYLHGEFRTYEEALKEAKEIVEEHIKSAYKPGKTAGELETDYNMFGEDPVIISEPPQANDQKFSAREYAHEFAEIYFREKSKLK